MSRRREEINWSGVCPYCPLSKAGQPELCRLPRSSRESSSGLKETVGTWEVYGLNAAKEEEEEEEEKTRCVLRNIVYRYAHVGVVI